MKTEFEKAWDRLMKKGGTMHMSLERGVVAHVKGEVPIVLRKPIEDWDTKVNGTGPLSGDY